MAEHGNGSPGRRGEWTDHRYADLVREVRQHAVAAARHAGGRSCPVCAGLGAVVIQRAGKPFSLPCIACSVPRAS
ncbi:hypothetical protein LRS74_18590 [Streptomyces sp. LX-29]|uniref:hypothetical protein n=1 Tax=Streptomyces sp. LX-29 TaxID=2900152 RepID=UPI00240DE003|nr:hypothetical protein [Streptomyces sp. LX-29]WFB08828.1 hypothetical protein LRS74_18590 [Streptomyces sp. LX-29]